MSAHEQLYGSDQNGFVWGFVFRPGEAAQPVTASIATGILAEAKSSDAKIFIWLHFG